ncbi:ABC transporter substrate-binding protein [Psychromonas sp. RZ5]|nr:ABC transporter substrate-binding protein [Psychromonas sp. RZ5]
MRLLFLLFLTANLTACYQNKTLTKNTLLYCTENQPMSFNPQISHDIASLDATTHQLFSRLVKLNPDTNKFIPDLAESWQQSDDKLRYRFVLRKNINFHQTDYFQPTRYLNADDVLFSFNRMIDKKHPYHTVNNQTQNYFFNHPFTAFLSEINKIDDRTVEFVLSKPDVTLLANLAAHYAVIHSQEYANQLLQRGHPEKIDFQPIGTGPFKFKSSNSKGIVRYSKHENYWQPMTNIENLIYVKNPSATKRYTKLLSGECDVIAYPAASQLETISKNKEVVLNSKSTSNVALWAFNTKQDQLKDSKVRYALSQAIDKKTILQAVYFQSAMQTNTLLSNQSWAHKARNNSDIFNPEAAKKTLVALDYDFTKVLTILLPENADVFNPNFHKTAQLIQANLADIGIQSEIVKLSGSTLQTRLSNGNYDTYLTGINVHINDPDSIFRPLLSCNSSPENGNSSRWCSYKTQVLLDQSLTESNFAQRIKNYYLIQDEIMTQRPYLPIAHVLRLDVISGRVKNVEVNSLTGINFQNTIKQDLN